MVWHHSANYVMGSVPDFPIIWLVHYRGQSDRSNKTSNCVTSENLLQKYTLKPSIFALQTDWTVNLSTDEMLINWKLAGLIGAKFHSTHHLRDFTLKAKNSLSVLTPATCSNLPCSLITPYCSLPLLLPPLANYSTRYTHQFYQPSTAQTLSGGLQWVNAAALNSRKKGEN